MSSWPLTVELPSSASDAAILLKCRRFNEFSQLLNPVKSMVKYVASCTEIICAMVSFGNLLVSASVRQSLLQ